ncbi:MAG: flagellar biosynthesis protein [Deltaproteobacteria bacterium]|nr:MAG: flagellar biosynthesis protein [Deltaproteobacteria bacterium]
MSRQLFLEDFDSEPAAGALAPGESVAPAEPEPVYSADDLEKARLAGYEAGFKAGWDDATAADEREYQHISAELRRNLQDLGFTYHEARTHVLNTLEPLLRELIEKVLPKIWRATLADSIKEAVMELAENAAEAPIEIVMRADDRAIIEPMIGGQSSLPLSLVEEESLAEGQIFLRSGHVEREIDFSLVLEKLEQALSAFYQLNEKAFKNG